MARGLSFLTALVFLLSGAVPTAAETLSVTVVALPQCSDTVDNDGDSVIDFPSDTDCDSATDTTESIPLPPPSPAPRGGGGGGGSTKESPSGTTEAIFRGKAYPGSRVTILKDAQVKATTVAASDGSFDVTVKKLAGGTYTFSVHGTDVKGVQSTTHTFTVVITSNVTNIVSGIFLPPTISLDKKEVRYGEVLTITGTTNPSAEVTVFVHSEKEVVKKVAADVLGAWVLKLDTTEVGYGNHTAQSRAAKVGEMSPLSKILSFKIGALTVPSIAATAFKGDSNGDGRVNLVDFSVVAYWYKRASPPASADLNGDGQVSIVDFSIMAYNWNG